MLWKEFEEKVGAVSEETYNFANRIYAYHPIIPDVGGKEKIANLFLHSTPRNFFKLYEEATYIMDIEEKIFNTKQFLRDPLVGSFLHQQAAERLKSFEQIKTDCIKRLKEKYNL